MVLQFRSSIKPDIARIGRWQRFRQLYRQSVDPTEAVVVFGFCTGGLERNSSPAGAVETLSEHVTFTLSPPMSNTLVFCPVETLDSPTETLDSPAEAPPGRSPEHAAVGNAYTIAGSGTGMSLPNAIGQCANIPRLEPIATEGQ